GPDGLMWFTESSGTVGSVDPNTGQLVEYKNVGSGYDRNTHQAAFAPDGSLWFTEYGSHKVARFDTTAHTVSEIDLGAAIDGPVGLAAGFDGGIWFTTATSVCRIDPVARKITAAFPVADHTAIPEKLTPGADHNLWFTSNYQRYGSARAS